MHKWRHVNSAADAFEEARLRPLFTDLCPDDQRAHIADRRPAQRASGAPLSISLCDRNRSHEAIDTLYQANR